MIPRQSLDYPSIHRADEAESNLSYSFWLGTFIIRGSVAPRVLLDVLGFGLLTVAIVATIQWLEKLFRVELSVPVVPLEGAQAVLGLLLVLRVNAGYNRWWETNVLWGGIVNQSRNLAVAGMAYEPRNTLWRSRFVRWIAAFPYVCRKSLREQRNFPELERFGGCERILKTPLARSEAIQVRQVIFLLLITLPIGLLKAFDANSSNPSSLMQGINQVGIVPLYVMLLAYPLLSLDRIGMELQNPFSTQRIDFLPLESICTAIERDVLEFLHDMEDQPPSAPRAEDAELPLGAEFSPQNDNLLVDIS